jgi:hypothetical protein
MMICRVFGHKLWHFVVLCALAFGIASIPTSVPALISVDVTISGRVRDGTLGVPEARVTLFDFEKSEIAKSTTDLRGEYTLRFQIPASNASQGVYIYALIRGPLGSDSHVDTYSRFQLIGRRESRTKVEMKNVEFEIIKKERALGVVDRINKAGQRVNLTKGILAGVVESVHPNSDSLPNGLIPLKGATVKWTDLEGEPVPADLIYFSANPDDPKEPGQPDPTLTATSECGTFLLYNIEKTRGGFTDLIISSDIEGVVIPDWRARVFPAISLTNGASFTHGSHPRSPNLSQN